MITGVIKLRNRKTTTANSGAQYFAYNYFFSSAPGEEGGKTKQTQTGNKNSHDTKYITYYRNGADIAEVFR